MRITGFIPAPGKVEVPISIGSNISALQAERRLNEGSETLSRVYERLSSGQRINRASDDAAGLAIASSLNADSRVFHQGFRNFNDGISLLNVAQGAIDQLSGISLRQKELSEQAANGIYSSTQRAALNIESNRLTEEYNRIIETTKFNGTALLDGSMGVLRLQGGYGVTGILEASLDLSKAGDPDGTFADGTSFDLPAAEKGSILSGDLNGDAKADLIELTSTGISVLIGNGDGSFRSAVAYSSPIASLGGFNGENAALADLNRDGILDVVATSSSTAGNNIGVYIGNGDGSFNSARTYANATGAQSIAIADLNGDGINDLAIGISAATRNMSILLGNSDGSFKARVTYGAAPLLAISQTVAVDFNGDGALDLLTVSTGGFPNSLLIGNGNGTFKASISADVVGRGVAVGDFDEDGKADVAASLDVYLSNGDGLFHAAGSSLTNSSASLLAIDLNGDGHLDVVGNGNEGYLGVMFGNGDGTFSQFQSAGGPLEFGSEDLVSADFNGDGARDVIGVAAGSASAVYIAGKSSPLVQMLDLSTQVGARAALEKLTTRISALSSVTGQIGSVQSRLTVALATLEVGEENYRAASSRIMDADIADESSQLTRTQILQQTASAILAQANQQPALALQLLR